MTQIDQSSTIKNNHGPPAAPRASAPGWTEDLKAHFLSRRSAHRTSQPVAQVSADWDESGEDALKLVVRNTFLELQEVGWERMGGIHGRGCEGKFRGLKDWTVPYCEAVCARSWSPVLKFYSVFFFFRVMVA